MSDGRCLESHRDGTRVPGLGRPRLDRLRPEHVGQLHIVLLHASYFPATVLRHHHILSSALAPPRSVTRNVAGLVDLPTQEWSDIAAALDVGEARADLKATAHARNSSRWALPLRPTAVQGLWRCSGRTPTCSRAR